MVKALQSWLAAGHEAPPGAPAEGGHVATDDEAPESRVKSKNVLVAFHGGRAHVGAIEFARVIAGALRAPLHGLFVSSEPVDASELPARVGLAPEALEGVVLNVAVTDDPRGALTAATESGATGLVIVASEPGEALDERLGLSALAAHALQSMACGVVVIRPSLCPSRLRRILLPLDGMPSTAAAITPVGALARQLGAELDIVMVGGASPRRAASDAAPCAVSTPERPEPGSMVAPLYVDQPQHEWAAFTEEFLDRFLNAIGRCPHDVSTRFFLGAGVPSAEILRFASELESDLIVLVWHGQIAEEHGSTFCDVIRGAPCPALVLRR